MPRPVTWNITQSQRSVIVKFFPKDLSRGLTLNQLRFSLTLWVYTHFISAFIACFWPCGLCQPASQKSAWTSLLFNPHLLCAQPWPCQDGIGSFLINSGVCVGLTLNLAMLWWQLAALRPSQTVGSLCKFLSSGGGDKIYALVRLSCFRMEENRVIWWLKMSWNHGLWFDRNLETFWI